jgi:hypothetical protein
MIKERKEISLLIKEAQEVGARQSKACEIVGISEKTLQIDLVRCCCNKGSRFFELSHWF